MTAIAWDRILSDLSDVDIITDPTQIAKLSLDYYHFSPILSQKLKDKRGDVVIRPTTTEEILKIAQICVKYRLPLTVRGAGTGNYGQCIPLRGGIILDLTKMTQIRWIREGSACVEAGVKLAVLDKKAREMGWELRMMPSTYRTATVGGFIAGGSGGIGSITYGQLRDRGNVQRIQVVTLEDTPQVIELQGDDIQKVAHAYGTNGIITELEIALSPAYPWLELIVVFPDFMTAARFGQALSESDGIVKKLVSIHDGRITGYFTALKDYLPTGKSAALLMISAYDFALFQEWVREYHGEITYQNSFQDSNKKPLLLEFTWNHTTLHARNVDPSLTYLQTLYFTLANVEQCYHYFGDEVMIHLEFMRVEGKAIPSGLPLVRFTTEERLNEMIRYHEAQGIFIANPHTYILEDGGRKVIDPVQLNFKKQVDPYGLMNPDKMRGFQEIVG